MQLTRFGTKGLVFYGVLLTAFLATPYSNLYFLLIAFLSVQWALCVVWTFLNLRGVSATLSELEPVPAGIAASIRGRIESRGRRARFQIAIELELVGACRGRGQAVVVQGGAPVAVRLPPLARGVYDMRRAWVCSSYPLGLLRARRRIENTEELIVYPAPAELAQARAGEPTLAEMLGHSAGPGHTQPSGLRDRHDADELRDVHWRASARRGALVVKEWAGATHEGLEIVLDRRCSAAALDRALSLLSGLVAAARETKELLTIHSQGLRATFGPGHQPWRAAVCFLARADALASDAQAPPPASPSILRLPLASDRSAA